MSTGEPRPYEPPRRSRQGAPPPGGPAPRSHRPRARNLVPLGIAAWAVLEIWLLMLVGEAAGGLTVVLLLVAGLVLGAVAVKRAGRRAWRNLAESVQQAQAQAQAQDGPAGAAATDDDRPASRKGNGLAMLGGLLLMTPGLLTDVFGLFCLFPPTAALLRRGTERIVLRGSLGEAVVQARSAEQQAHIRRPDGKIVEGEVLRDDEPPTR